MHKNTVARTQHVAYTTCMTAALGSYVKTLRLRQGLSKAEVLRQLSLQFGQSADRSTLYRAEKGEHWPDGDFLTALMGIIGGRIEDLIWIRRNQNATELDGCRLAEAWVREHGKPADVETVVRAQSRTDAVEIADELEELAKRIRAGRE